MLSAAGKAKSFLSPVLLNISILLSYTASLHIWSQHWGIFSSDWRDPECFGRSLFFSQRGKIFETFPSAVWVGVGENQTCLSYSLALAATMILVVAESYKSFFLGLIRSSPVTNELRYNFIYCTKNTIFRSQ